MSARNVATLMLSATLLLALTACAGGPTVSEQPTSSASVDRQEAEERVSDVQRRIIEAFPSGSVAETKTGSWTLLSCSEGEVQSSIGADLILAESVPVDATYSSMMRGLESDGYTAERGETSHGPRLVITGKANDQYFVSILNDTKRVQISSFSQCFRGALTDG